MYSNSFNEAEKNLFVNRLMAAKEDKSHYHQALVKQLEIDIRLKALSGDFEIGGDEEREGVEFDEGDMDANNHTLSTVNIPGVGVGAGVEQIEMQEMDGGMKETMMDQEIDDIVNQEHDQFELAPISPKDVRTDD